MGKNTAEVISGLLKAHADFSYECSESGYTDSGDLWALVDGMADALSSLLSQLQAEKDEPTTKAREGLLGEVIDGRMQVYGDPVIGMCEIAEMWAAYLGTKIEAHQVPVMMMLMKIQRSKVSPDYSDHIEDIKGYADIFEKVFGEDMIHARTASDYIAQRQGHLR